MYNLHHTPTDDLKAHNEEGNYCHCQPVVIPQDENTTLIIHQSYRGVEFADAHSISTDLNPLWFYTSYLNDAARAYDGH